MKINLSSFSITPIIHNLESMLKKLVWTIGKQAFWFILVILFIEMIFAEFLIYQYVISVEIKEPEITDSSVGLQKKAYDTIIKKWQTQDDFFKNYPSNNPSNPFQ